MIRIVLLALLIPIGFAAQDQPCARGGTELVSGD